MLDGKYEITSERELDARTTLFAATAPDGTALHICWYDLHGPDEERNFESYRILLRQLRREGYAAIYDLVARPGAYYVAWHIPEGSAPPQPERLAAIEAILERHGRTLERTRICSSSSTPGQVFELPFNSAANVASPFLAPLMVPSRPVDNLWTRLWLAFRPWAVGCVLALLGVLFALLGIQRTLDSRLIDVPDVRGEPIGTALASLYGAGFTTEAIPLRSSRLPGTVIDLNPAVGTLLRPGRTLSVSYALSAGRPAKAVPSITSRRIEQAEVVLNEAGFELGDVARVANRAPRGTIIAQNPGENTQVAEGARVQILLSTGPAPSLTFLPDLTGLALEDALVLAEAAGFPRSAVRQDLTPGTDAAAGTVLDQSIKPFLSVPQSAQLRLSVAASSALENEANETPNLIGLSLNEAQLQARGLGLSIVQSAEVDTLQLPPGIVLQNPAPGATLQNRIEVTVNRLPEATPSLSENREGGVRRAEYSWFLPPERLGTRATVTVTTVSGSSDVLIRDQRVMARTLSGVYLTTVSGPLTFRLTLDGQAYDPPLTLDP